MKKLCKNKKKKLICGVCAGIADSLSVDIKVIRIIYFILSCLSLKLGCIVYLLLAAFLPEK